MPILESIRISGYRAISSPLILQGLSSYVALYGDNAVGKSSVLQAVELLGMLTDAAVTELLGSGTPWPGDSFYEHFHQDRAMFNARSAGEVLLEGTWSDGLKIGFHLRRESDGVTFGVETLEDQSGDLRTSLLDAAQQSRRALVRFASPSPELRQSESNLYNDAQSSGERLDTLTQALRTRITEYSKIRLIPSPSLPVSDAVRAAYVAARNSGEMATRRSARQATAAFRDLFPALGPGELDALENPPLHPKDVAWVGDWTGVIPLDRLGGGVQSAFSSIAQLMLSNANIACLEEPEAFVGQRALGGLTVAFRAAIERGICEQVWVATHALTLASETDHVYVLEMEEGVVTARGSRSAELSRLAPDVTPPRPLSLGRLADDGSVRLPPTLVKHLGLVTGDFVHYVDIDETGARIVSPAVMEQRYGKDDAE